MMTSNLPAVAALTLGPIAYHWSADTRRDFYAKIADETPIDTVYLGEVICSKRAPFFANDLPEIAERLIKAGKTVVFSSLAEVMTVRERRITTEMMTLGEAEVEVNNSAGLLAIDGRPHRLGPFMNVYNEETLSVLAGRGAHHVCLPAELPGPAVALMAEAAAALGVGIEVQVFGRAPLATSARCYHARAHGRTKDNCRFVCEEDPDGMPLSTRDGVPFLRVNGVQTQSETYLALIEEIAYLKEIGVSGLRLMPQQVDMVSVAAVFDDLRRGMIESNEAEERLSEICIGTRLSNGFFHGLAGYRRITKAAASFS